MKIPADAIIAEVKLTEYLLIPKDEDDKSLFLEQAGFTLDNPDDLINGIRQMNELNEAVEDRRNKWGIYYRVEGYLLGVNGRSLEVVTIWIQDAPDSNYRFVTLKPLRKRQ